MQIVRIHTNVDFLFSDANINLGNYIIFFKLKR